jgi:regulatory protein
VSSRSARGDGPVKIQHQLHIRGVDSTLAVQAMTHADINWVESAARVRTKRFGAATPASYEERARQSRFLAQRGFSSDQIRKSFACGDEQTF